MLNFDQLRSKIIKGKHKEVFKLLEKGCGDEDLRNQLRVLETQYTAEKRNLNMGLTDFQSASITFNRVTAALLDIISGLETETKEDNAANQDSVDIKVNGSDNIIIEGGSNNNITINK